MIDCVCKSYQSLERRVDGEKYVLFLDHLLISKVDFNIDASWALSFLSAESVCIP